MWIRNKAVWYYINLIYFECDLLNFVKYNTNSLYTIFYNTIDIKKKDLS